MTCLKSKYKQINNITNMTEQEFKEVKDYVLKEIDLWSSRPGCPITPYEFILMWIDGHCKNTCWSDTKSANKQYKGIYGATYTSYGLKHRIERDYPVARKKGEYGGVNIGYCANNWVKCALYELGYEVKNDETGKEPTFDDMLNNGVNLVWRKIK